MKGSEIKRRVLSTITKRLKRFKGPEDCPVNKEIRFGRGDDKFLFSFKLWRTPPTSGLTSFFHSPNCKFKPCNCSPDKQLYMADYDDTPLAEIFRLYNPLVESGRLPFVWIVSTRSDQRHYHVISPCLFTRIEKISLMLDAKVSSRYIGFGVSIGRHTLRLVKKDARKSQITFVSGLRCSDALARKNRRQVSETHFHFLAKFYEIPQAILSEYRSMPLEWVKGRVEVDNYYASNFVKKGAKE